jgi:hypothetical protein
MLLSRTTVDLDRICGLYGRLQMFASTTRVSRAGHPGRFLAMATLESVRTLLATFEAYHDKDFGEVVFDRILIVGDRVLSLVMEERIASRASSCWTTEA